MDEAESVDCKSSVAARRRRRGRLLAVLVGCLSIVSPALTPTAADAAGSLSVRQLEFPIPLVARGDRVEMGYDAAGNLSATGVLYVRNDLQRSFTRVPLERRKAEQQLVPSDSRRLLRAVVPGRLLRGHELLYYAVVRDPKTGRSVKVPAAGARSPESVWIVNGAVRVNLGTHRFGHLQAPEAVVARAGPADVAFENPPEGARFGPWSFEVAADRSIWLLDELDKRLLVWAPEQPDTVQRSVELPFYPIDFALGPEETLYLTGPADSTDPPAYPGGFPPIRLYRLTGAGGVLWESRLATDIFNTQLRVGPDGTLYWTGPYPSPRTERGAQPVWTPAATPAGQPVSRAQQRRQMSFGRQPLPGGLSLVAVVTDFVEDPVYGLAPHEQRFALVDRAGRIVRAWRVTSKTVIWPHLQATPGLVGGDPVVVLEVTRGSGQDFEREYVALRLSAGGTKARFSLPHDPPQGAFGDVITDLRVGPDGKLYQLGSSPESGVVISRFSLGSVGAADRR